MQFASGAEPPHLSLVRSCMFFFAQIFCTDAAWVVKIVNLELSRKRNQSINTLGRSGLLGCPQDQGKHIQTTNRIFACIYSMQNNALRLTQPKNCEGKKISEVVQCPLPLNPYDNGKVFIGNCNSSNVACLVPPRHRRATVLEHGQMFSLKLHSRTSIPTRRLAGEASQNNKHINSIVGSETSKNNFFCSSQVMSSQACMSVGGPFRMFRAQTHKNIFPKFCVTVDITPAGNGVKSR